MFKPFILERKSKGIPKNMREKMEEKYKRRREAKKATPWRTLSWTVLLVNAQNQEDQN